MEYINKDSLFRNREKIYVNLGFFYDIYKRCH